MAFKDIDQRLIDECTKDVVDIDKIKKLITEGADINAFDEEYEQTLYDEVLDYYIFEGRERRLNLHNLFVITELFAEYHLVLNQEPDDSDYFLLNRFRFLPPEKICVDVFKVLLEKCTYSFKDIDSISTDATLDLHLGEYYFFEQTHNYSETDSLVYFLELIYWACAYSVKTYPEKCSNDLLHFKWFSREKNKIEAVFENRSTSVFMEDLETHRRVEIDGWSMKY
ncbi:MAG: hypothetical protein IKW50_06735 [Oscillospiraceae bacterium]|nr:hypothetical protein [Oscillospiraceae bacterium]